MRNPPRIATWLLRHTHDESLAGDLVEEYERGRSALWFYGQTVAAVLKSERLPGIRELLREPSAAMLIFTALAISSAILTLVMTLMLAVAGDPPRPGVIPAEWAPGRSIAWFVIALVFLSLLTAVQFLPGKSRSALKIFTAASTVTAAYSLILIMTSLIAPATIVNPAAATALTCRASESKTPIELIEERTPWLPSMYWSSAMQEVLPRAPEERGSIWWMSRARRFPSAVPLDVVLTPGQSVRTSVRFVVPHDAQHLFLTEDLQANANDPWFTRLYLGADFSLFHKHWLLEVA